MRTILKKVNAPVEPGQTVICRVVAMQSHVNLRYSATLEHRWKGGESYEYPVVGAFENAEASEAITYCEDAEDPDVSDVPQPGKAATDTAFTESGTYCPDGKRVSDEGMLDEELLAACPI